MKAWELVAIALAILSAIMAVIFARSEKPSGRWRLPLALLVVAAGFSSGHFANSQLTAEDSMPKKKSVVASETRVLPRPPFRYADPMEQKRFESLWVTVSRLAGPPKSTDSTPRLERDGKELKAWWEE